jgi:hypothetical protein
MGKPLYNKSGCARLVFSIVITIIPPFHSTTGQTGPAQFSTLDPFVAQSAYILGALFVQTPVNTYQFIDAIIIHIEGRLPGVLQWWAFMGMNGRF